MAPLSAIATGSEDGKGRALKLAEERNPEDAASSVGLRCLLLRRRTRGQRVL